MEQTIGRYRLLEKIGSGGMGSVFRAQDPTLDRPVAIKFLPTSASQNPERFLREARIAARLNHPNIINVFDIAEMGDGVYIVQEFLEGSDLEQILRNAPDHRLAVGRAIDVLAQVARGLAFAHTKNVVHRDVKPGNVWVLADGQVKVIDFGIALATDDYRLTVTGAFVGTVSYIAPELLQEDTADHKLAEVFSFGALAYEVMTGARAFAAESLQAIFQKIISFDPPPLDTVVDTVPHDVSALVRSCLEKDPRKRPQSMDEVASRLTAIGTSATIIQTPSRPGPEVSRLESLPQMSAPLPVVPSDQLPRPLGRFTLVESVSAGQTGILYKAFDPVRGALVGVKVVSSESAVDRARLLRAGKIWLDLHHPNIVRVLEVDPGNTGHGPLIVTDLIDGRKLSNFVQEVPLTTEQRLHIALQLCDALTAIHRKGVIHREVRPDSILIVREGLKAMLLDSGIARTAAAVDSRLTRTGVAVGDFAYMAPEQLEGRPEQRSDLYSLAAVLLFLLTKEAPAIGDIANALEKLRRIRGVSPQLILVLQRALTQNPEDRYESAEAFADALREVLPPTRIEISRSRVIVTLHGIRTDARWQRAFSEVAAERGFYCRLDKWNFGYFSVFKFLLPWSRLARVSWFRKTYQEEFPDLSRNRQESELPSIVAHSFGTYILGNALTRYPYLRFNKVILCGSILPRSFPWDALLERGQVQAVRNEYGAEDFWTRVVDLVVPGTGGSGLTGFTCKADKFEQEEFEFTHSEYFERSHMDGRWLPFLRRRMPYVEPLETPAPRYRWRQPWLLYAGYAGVLALSALAGWLVVR